MWKPRASKLYARRVLRTAKRNLLNLAFHRETHAKETPWAYRSFNEQEEFLSRVTRRITGKKGLGLSFASFCEQQARSGKSLRILEDGPGNGDLLVGLKRELNARRIKTETIGISLVRNPQLLSRVTNHEIDRVHWGIAERYVPRKPVDIILSIFGSLCHTFEEVKKDHLLKFAYSLRPGGGSWSFPVVFHSNMHLGRTFGVHSKNVALKRNLFPLEKHFAAEVKH